MSNHGVYIVLVNYCGEQLTRECVASLLKQNNLNFKIVIVDNASPDGSGKVLENEYKGLSNVKVLLSSENNGFSDGNNIGIKYSLEQGALAVLLLNNDTEVDVNFFNSLMTNWKFDTIRTGRINYFYNKKDVWYANGRFNEYKGIVENGKPEVKTNVNFASGCCMLIPSIIIKDVGLLSDEYFMYYEDVDYCLRIAQANYKIEYIPNAIVYHKVGKTSGGEESKLSIYYNNRNRLILMKKFKLPLRCKIYTYCTRIIRLVHGTFRGTNDKIIFKAWKDYRKGIIGKVEDV